MAAKAKTPLMRGYTRIPGTSRYRSPRGKEISRREYDNRRLKKLGWKNRYEAEKYRESGSYLKWRHRMLTAGRKPSELTIFSPFARRAHEIDIVKAEKEVQRIRGEYRTKKAAGYDPRLRDPDGPLSEMLEWLGFRDMEMEWDVGDTP